MLGPWDFVVVALAAYRMTRFVVFDSLIGFNLDSGSPASRWLDVWAWNADGSDKPGFGGWLRNKVATLLLCPYCIGFWITLACWATWTWAPSWCQYVLVAWAAAGAQALLSTLDRRMQ